MLKTQCSYNDLLRDKCLFNTSGNILILKLKIRMNIPSKLLQELYQSRYISSAIYVRQDTNNQCQTNGHDLINAGTHSYLSNKLLSDDSKPMGTTLSALNVNMDTSVAIKQVLRWSMPKLWTWYIGSECQPYTSLAIKQTLMGSMLNQWARCYWIWMSIQTQA